MRTEVFLRRDIAATIQAIASAHSDLAMRVPSRDAALYSAGFTAALRAVALAFHLDTDLAEQDAKADRPIRSTDHILGLTDDEWHVIPIDTTTLTSGDS